jgi:DNA-binding protein YbaB
MELFKMAKEAIAMRSKLSEIDKKLRSQVMSVEYKDIKIRVNAKCEFLSLDIPEGLLKEKKNNIEKFILSAFEEAGKKARNVMTEEAKKLTDKIKIPGL